MEFEGQETSIIEEDYYGTLNVSKEATPEDITKAYRSLSRLYHPDKHVNADDKKKAELLFNKIKKAYEVLIDPHQRAIYDTVGTKGLTTDGWEIVQKTKTPQEIRDEYEQLERKRKERRLQQITNPKGNVVVSINATDIFSQYDDEDEYMERSFFPNVEISGMSISQSIEAPLTLRDTVTLNGNLSTHNGTGNGSFSMSSKRLLLSNGWVEGELTVGGGPFATFKLFRTLTKHIFSNFTTQMKLTPNGIRLGFVTSLGMQLNSNTHGYLTLNMGLTSAMTTMIVRDTEFSHSGAVISFGLASSFISANHVWKINKADLKLRVYCKVGTVSSSVECSAEKKVSELSSFSAAVSVGVPAGVSLKLKIIRAHQTYVFPIHLCEEPRFIPSLYAAVAPIVVWVAVKKFVVEPFVKEQKEKDIEKQRQLNKNKMEERKREAVAAVQLMSAAYARIRSEEAARNGLVIAKALYGKNANDMSEASMATKKYDVIDVTIPLQCMVRESSIKVHDTSKSQLPGFYDPCVGEDKVLFVQYHFHSHLFEVTIADNESLRIPKKSHRVDN